EDAFAALGRLTAAAAAPPQPEPEPTPRRAAPSRNGRDVLDRARAYLARCDPAISGQKGHNKAFGVACRVGPGFDLDPEVALALLRAVYNPTCRPPWSEEELQHKITDAYARATRRGWLLD